MDKLPQHGTFTPLFHVYLDVGLSYHQAALIAYIHKWHRGGNECFASVEDISKELRLTYITMRRVIDRLLAESVITASTGDKGRARTLKITQLFWDKVEAKLASKVLKVNNSSAHNEQGECSNRADDLLKVSKVCAQSEQLPRSNLDPYLELIPKPNTNTNTEINLIWSEEKQAMVRVRR